MKGHEEFHLLDEVALFAKKVGLILGAAVTFSIVVAGIWHFATKSITDALASETTQRVQADTELRDDVAILAEGLKYPIGSRNRNVMLNRLIKRHGK